MHTTYLQVTGFLARNISICDPTITIASDHVSFDNTTIQFTIPPSVGPDGANYGVSIQLFQTDGSRYSVDVGSNIFNLSSATGNWSKSQLADWVLSSPDTIPCSSFACVKNCADMVWNLTMYAETSNDTVYRDCAAKCPGVTIPLVQGEAASSSTTSVWTSLITYTHGIGETTTLASRTPPVCPTTTASQSGQASETESSSTPTSTSTSTGTVASPTKSSAADRLSGRYDRAWLWGWNTVLIAALLESSVW